MYKRQLFETFFGEFVPDPANQRFSLHRSYPFLGPAEAVWRRSLLLRPPRGCRPDPSMPRKPRRFPLPPDLPGPASGPARTCLRTSLRPLSPLFHLLMLNPIFRRGHSSDQFECLTEVELVGVTAQLRDLTDRELRMGEVVTGPVSYTHLYLIGANAEMKVVERMRKN